MALYKQSSGCGQPDITWCTLSGPLFGRMLFACGDHSTGILELVPLLATVERKKTKGITNYVKWCSDCSERFLCYCREGPKSHVFRMKLHRLCLTLHKSKGKRLASIHKIKGWIKFRQLQLLAPYMFKGGSDIGPITCCTEGWYAPPCVPQMG